MVENALSVLAVELWICDEVRLLRLVVNMWFGCEGSQRPAMFMFCKYKSSSSHEKKYLWTLLEVYYNETAICCSLARAFVR